MNQFHKTKFIIESSSMNNDCMTWLVSVHMKLILMRKGEIFLKIWKLRLRLWFYKLLIKLGLKSEEIYYIGGSTALPPPLSKEEERKLLSLLSKGDKSARAVLIERNLRLVVYIARKFENTGINIEDLIKIGRASCRER